MSRFSGKQHKGAMREYKAEQKAEYERMQEIYRKRNKAYPAGLMTSEERLLVTIFGIDAYLGMGEQVPLDEDVIPDWEQQLLDSKSTTSI